MPGSERRKSKGLPRRTELSRLGGESREVNYIALILLLIALIGNILVLLSFSYS